MPLRRVNRQRSGHTKTDRDIVQLLMILRNLYNLTTGSDIELTQRDIHQLRILQRALAQLLQGKSVDDCHDQLVGQVHAKITQVLHPAE